MAVIVVLSILAVFSALGAFAILLYLVYTHSKAPKFSNSIKNIERASKKPSVSVIVTARNEEDKIARCLRSLSSQKYQYLEIVVIDDSSSDDTRKIVEQFTDPRIIVVDAGTRPEGWVGKSWPCWRGYESSKGEILLFVDADSVFDPSIVEETVNYLLVRGYDMLSISPEIILKGVWASATLPLVSGAIDLLYPMIKVNDPRSQRAYVFGTYILVRRSAYAAIDGHRSVRSLLVEDAAIAQTAKSRGYRLRVEIGKEFLSTDWEEEGSKIYSGLERITSSSIKRYGLVSNLNAVLLFFIAIFPILLILGSLALRPTIYLEIGVAASVLNIVIFLIICATEVKLVTNRVGLLPFLYPLGMLIFISAIITTSIKVSRGKGIEWKGRSYT
ncbi:MAG: glycosyltransferase family 2 protein [Nitrososphaerales archaeon]